MSIEVFAIVVVAALTGALIAALAMRSVGSKRAVDARPNGQSVESSELSQHR